MTAVLRTRISSGPQLDEMYRHGFRYHYPRAEFFQRVLLPNHLRIQEKMDAQQHLQSLRLSLLDMSKLSQRAVDYATKGYRLGSPEFCRYVRRGDHQLGELRRNITNLCQRPLPHGLSHSEALMDEWAVDTELRFPQAALRICDAF